MSKFRAEIEKFCNTTSAAGLSRILKSRGVFLKVLWTFFILICTALLIYFLVAIFVEYYKWPITTEFGEDHKANIIFPDITICSLNRVLNDKVLRKKTDQFFRMIEDLEKIEEIDDDDMLTLEELNNIPSFLRNFQKLWTLDEDCPRFLTECVLYGKNWKAVDKCTEYFTEIWNIDYYSCFTIRTSKISNRTTIRGISLVLNNGPPYDVQVPYRTYLDKSQGNGVHVTIHKSGTSPDMKRGITLSPGTENDITIVQTNVVRLDKPYNPLGCTNQKYLLESPSVRYTQDQCIEQCYQAKIYKACNCCAYFFSVPQSLSDAVLCGNLTGVGNETENGSNWFLELKCARVVSDSITGCASDCLIPCKDENYEYFLASRSWPHNSMQLAIYRKYFENCTRDFPEVLERYAAYDYMNKVRQNDSQVNSSEKNYTFADLRQISESLLVVKLAIKEDFPYHLVDKPLYTWDNMVGVVGGTLGVWMGISAANIAELIELIYCLVRSCF